MSRLPDFEGFAMFAKVAEEGSFAGAATAMGVSVATVSRAVTRLEERLGGRLFNRTSRRLALTDYGHTLIERAAKLYADAEDTEDFARETSSLPRGLVKLAAPLSFGTRWVAPLLPEFFGLYPDIAVDLHLTDAQSDLIGDGFDAALRIAILEDSSLVARLIAPVRRFVVASPAYLARHGRPRHPQELGAHACLTYTNRSQRDVWRFTRKNGETCAVTPGGMLRGTSVEALLPTVLAGLAITELPEFVATQYFADRQLEPVLTDWRLPEGGLYFVTPSARARPAKVGALADFFIARLATAEWRAPAKRAR
ncbi:LysR family transcriptional regulator [Burkholderia stabilis]|uniref:LysR family transcriptional regulator n=1 Tax=Burkholderia stabilis TaxID=95485 RepID=UPI0008520CD0|nr:LysR family transcriptional regulator [Burkholderia stabilis]AOR73381.1 LysR family transcriptional regulator [Burkholderia stabilis]HDR9489552.1 LysR family transcriptional regulator [Burkholderia stabilis]HDR9536369.1 LysR family transcriptional regulator [Burkholderia stabilis]HDR9551883.1 LysR family transcriptional regulator [Burkholderia stabilis]HDR9559899.1 LysR family transcriptional regulator [Burkholderia stabilis]